MASVKKVMKSKGAAMKWLQWNSYVDGKNFNNNKGKFHRKTTTAFRDEELSERLRILRAFELIPTCLLPRTPKSMTSSG